jgi:tryptophan synthase alpha chain
METECKTKNRLNALIDSDQKLHVAYLMPEFPLRGVTLPVLAELEKSGVNVVELGVPFSDPLADGPVIQRAALKAIENGVTLKNLLQLVKQARSSEQYKITIPIVLMGYYNPMYAFGVEAFIKEAASSGVDGLIVPDLPPEEAAEFRTLAEAEGLSLIFLISPVTSVSRISEIDKLSTHFSYCVSVNATTGTAKLKDGIDTDNLKTYLKCVRENTGKKFIVGFGIKTARQVDAIEEISDGVVVGSALLNAMENELTIEACVEKSGIFARSLFNHKQVG